MKPCDIEESTITIFPFSWDTSIDVVDKLVKSEAEFFKISKWGDIYENFPDNTFKLFHFDMYLTTNAKHFCFTDNLIRTITMTDFRKHYLSMDIRDDENYELDSLEGAIYKAFLENHDLVGKELIPIPLNWAVLAQNSNDRFYGYGTTSVRFYMAYVYI